MEHSHSVEEIRKRISAPKKKSNLRDVVFGSIDGTITTFAIVSGVEGAQLAPSVIVILGLANIFADGFSMAAGNYTATKAELDEIRQLRKIEERHIEIIPDGEIEEVRQIFSAKGLSGASLEQAVAAIIKNKKRWIDFMLVEEYGVLPESPKPITAAVTTFSAFILCGLLPLLPYILDLNQPFRLSIFMTFIVFFLVGTFKSRWSPQRWWVSGLETLSIGAVASGVAYFIGNLFA